MQYDPLVVANIRKLSKYNFTKSVFKKICGAGDLASALLYSIRVHGGNGCLNLYTPTSAPSFPPQTYAHNRC